jgi:hypothetical protein
MAVGVTAPRGPLGPIGLVAGEGALPLVIARAVAAEGRPLVLAALEHLADPALLSLTPRHITVNAGRIGRVIDFFKQEGVAEVIFAGKVPKSLLFSLRRGLRPDLRGLRTLARLRDFRDETILRAVDREFERDGMRVLGIPEVCPSLVTPEGVLGTRSPSKKELADVEFGAEMARAIGKLDIGQTVVVKDRAVMAVEAIEGTDAAIRRGGELSGGGAVVVKLSRPGQDPRFDLPVVGPSTLDAMREGGCAVLAVEAGGSLIVDRETFLAEASRLGIAVLGIQNSSACG